MHICGVQRPFIQNSVGPHEPVKYASIKIMSNVLTDQIGLKQQDSHTYTAGYDAEWTMGPSTLHAS
jgi:hypothetical protein